MASLLWLGDPDERKEFCDLIRAKSSADDETADDGVLWLDCVSSAAPSNVIADVVAMESDCCKHTKNWVSSFLVRDAILCHSGAKHNWRHDLTRKPSCRWQTRVTLAKSLHGLRKSSGVVSCIARFNRLPIDTLHMVSYYCPIVTLCVKCTVFEIWRHIGWKSSKKPKPPSFGTFFGGDPLRIFRRLIPSQKLESWGYQMGYISRSCFRSARHNTGVWQTDRRTDTSLSQRPALA